MEFPEAESALTEILTQRKLERELQLLTITPRPNMARRPPRPEPVKIRPSEEIMAEVDAMFEGR